MNIFYDIRFLLSEPFYFEINIMNIRRAHSFLSIYSCVILDLCLNTTDSDFAHIFINAKEPYMAKLSNVIYCFKPD